jgi:diacylglycerol kinase family enzyme
MMLVGNPKAGFQLSTLLALATGQLDHDEDVAFVAAREIEVRSPAPVPVEIDGDPLGTTPLSIKAGGPRLTLIVPEAYAR